MRAALHNAAAGENHQLISDSQNPLLVGDDDNAGLALFTHVGKNFNQIVEAPKVDSGLWLVEQGKFGLVAAGQNAGDFNALQLAAGKFAVYLAVDVITGAEADFG